MFGLFHKKDKLPRILKRALAPHDDFVARTRSVFLAGFDERFGLAVPRPRYFMIAARILAVIFVIFGVTSGIAVYVDKTNVGLTSPLYSLKRYNESLQLILSKTSDQPALHIKFAQRRLAELEKLKVELPTASSTQIEAVKENTKEDMKEDMKRSLAATDEKDYPGENLPSFCRSFGDFISVTSSDLEDIMFKHPSITEKYQKKCARFLESNGSNKNDGRLNRENQIVTSTATSTDLRDNHDNWQRGHGNETGSDFIQRRENTGSKVENNDNQH